MSDNRLDSDLAPVCESLERRSVVRLRFDRSGNDNPSHLTGTALEGSKVPRGRYVKLLKRGL